MLQLSQWGTLILAYVLGTFTLMQFCESGSMKNRKFLYILYRIFTCPFYIITKVIFRKDLSLLLQQMNKKINNGRTYIITAFYYILYIASLAFTIYTSIQDINIVFPQVGEDKKAHWGIFKSGLAPIDIVKPYLFVLLFINHFASFISFALSVARNPNYKDETKLMKNKNVFYDNLLYLSTSKCVECDRIKPCRSSHCDNCKHCVQRRDHHCIWINQCVGRRNLLWFNIFLLSTGLACLFEAIIAFTSLKYAFTNMPSEDLNTYGLIITHKILPFKFIFRWALVSFPMLVASFLMHFLISCMLIPFSFSHILQILRNETSIEKSIQEDQMFLYRSQDGKLRLSEEKLEQLVEEDCNEDECNKVVFKLVQNKKQALKYLQNYRPYDKGIFQNVIEVIRDGFN